MRITDLTVKMVRIDATSWYGQEAPGHEPTQWDYPIVSVETDEGIVGYSMAYGAKNEGWPAREYLLKVYRPALIGKDPLDRERIWQTFRSMNRHLYGATDTNAGIIDVALWDIAGKAAGMPISTLLGRHSESVAAYRTIGRRLLIDLDRIPEMVEHAQHGVSAVKVQLWDSDPRRDIERLRVARAAARSELKLMHDAAGQYDLGQATEVARVLEELDFLWFEEPIPDAQITNLAHLRNHTNVPILAAETAPLALLPEYLLAGAVDIIRGDVLIKAGITGLRKAMALAELHGLRLEVHTGGAPLLDLANLHVAASAVNTTFIETHHDVFRFGLVGDPLEPDSQGMVSVPTSPGLGATLDWDWIDDHTVG